METSTDEVAQSTLYLIKLLLHPVDIPSVIKVHRALLFSVAWPTQLPLSSYTTSILMHLVRMGALTEEQTLKDELIFDAMVC